MKLTKHCYNLDHVLETLVSAIHKNHYTTIVFWIHECIESGFARECWEWLLYLPPRQYVERDETNWMPDFCYTLAFRLARPTSKLLIVLDHSTAQSMFPEPEHTSAHKYLSVWSKRYPYKINTIAPIPIDTLGNWTAWCEHTPYWQSIFNEFDVEPNLALENDDFVQSYGYDLEEQPSDVYQIFGFSHQNSVLKKNT